MKTIFMHVPYLQCMLTGINEYQAMTPVAFYSSWIAILFHSSNGLEVLTVRFSALQISRQWWMNDLYVEKIYSHFRFPAMLRHAIIIIITRWILKRLRRLQQNSFLLAALKIPSLNDILQRQNELHSSKSLLKKLKNKSIVWRFQAIGKKCT